MEGELVIRKGLFILETPVEEVGKHILIGGTDQSVDGKSHSFRIVCGEDIPQFPVGTPH